MRSVFVMPTTIISGMRLLRREEQTVPLDVLDVRVAGGHVEDGVAVSRARVARGHADEDGALLAEHLGLDDEALKAS